MPSVMAFVRDSWKIRKIVVDRVLSSVDSSTEKEIVNNLKELLDNITTIIISHRISTIRIADSIIVIDNGEIVETGTHAELIKQKKYYASFYEKQKIKEIIENNAL